MPITGYISVGLPIGPGSTNDPYYVTDPQYGLGGLRTVGTTAARDAIIANRREIGMMVYVSGNNTFYYLSGGTGNSYWIEFSGGGGASAGVSSIFGTPDEISVSANTGNVTLSLPKTVKIQESLYINGITLTSGTGTTLEIYSNLNVYGNINTFGSMSVDGLIITRTGFAGDTSTPYLETIESVLLDGGDF